MTLIIQANRQDAALEVSEAGIDVTAIQPWLGHVSGLPWDRSYIASDV